MGLTALLVSSLIDDKYNTIEGAKQHQTVTAQARGSTSRSHTLLSNKALHLASASTKLHMGKVFTVTNWPWSDPQKLCPVSATC